MEPSPQLGKYRVVRLLATGGMGEVFLARQEGPAGFAKTVVVKKILRHLATDQTFIDMFVNEARVAAALSHPNIVQIFELGQEDGTWFIAMEYVHGRSLRHVVEKAAQLERPIPPRLAARICSQALQGLHHAHRLTDEGGTPLGILHRDVSPENVLVSFGGGVKVVDFGVAKAAAWMTHTYSGTIKGKSHYLAPEQVSKVVPADPRSDVYAMGVVLYELLVGAPPFADAVGVDVLEAIAQRAPAPLIERNPEIPTALNAIVLRALSKNRDERWASADDMANALEAFIASQGGVVGSAHIAEYLRELFGPEAMVRHQSQVDFLLDLPPAGTASLAQGVPMHTAMPSAEKRLGDSVAGTQRIPVSGAPSVQGGTQRIAVDPGLLAEPGTVLVSQGEPVGLALADPHDPVLQTQHFPVPELGDDPPTLRTSAWTSPVPRRRWLGWAGGAIGLGLVVAGVWYLGLSPSTSPAPDLPPGPAHPSEPSAERPKAVRKKPRPGKVIVRVHPAAEVYYRGKKLGTTPIPPVEVPAGTATFLLKNKQLKVTRRVSVKVPAGGEVVLKANLLEKAGK